MSCVTKIAVSPSRRRRSRNDCCRRSRVSGSSAPNGSSSSMTRGSAASARARPTRCCWPPESSAGRRSRTRPARARPARAARRRARAIRAARPAEQRGVTAMFSATVRCGNRPTCWKHVADAAAQHVRRELARVSRPSMQHAPAVGSISRLIIFSVVVLPEPEPPTSTSSSPARHPQREIVHRERLAVAPGEPLELDHHAYSRCRGYGCERRRSAVTRAHAWVA